MSKQDPYFQVFQEACQMKTALMLVTPEMAGQWLEKNTHNRKVREKGVQLYVAEIKAGRWLVQHCGIAFDTNKVLVDGQHRLQAIVQAGIAVPLNVTFGVPTGSMAAVDRGMMRALHDVLKLEHGLDKAQRIVSIVNILARLEGDAFKLSPGRAMDLWRNWKPEIEWVDTYPSGGTLWVAPVVTAFAIARRTEPESTAVFADAYKANDGLAASNPVAYLIRKLSQDHQAKLLLKESLARWVLAVLFKAHNGEKISKNNSVKSDDRRGFDYYAAPHLKVGGAS